MSSDQSFVRNSFYREHVSSWSVAFKEMHIMSGWPYDRGRYKTATTKISTVVNELKIGDKSFLCRHQAWYHHSIQVTLSGPYLLLSEVDNSLQSVSFR